jgi:hypothetical protein
MTKDEALTKALLALAKVDALCSVGSNAEIYVRDALDSIKEVLAQPEQGPVCPDCKWKELNHD